MVGQPEVGYDDAQRRVALQHARDTPRSVVGLWRPRDRADVRQDEAVVLRDRVQHAAEARIVEREMLHVFVHLQAHAAAAQRFANVAGRIGVVEMHGGERERAGPEVARSLVQPLVQLARHPGFVRVGAKCELLDAVLAQDARHLARFGRMFEHPRAALGEPAADRGEQPRRMEVRVDVDHRAA